MKKTKRAKRKFVAWEPGAVLIWQPFTDPLSKMYSDAEEISSKAIRFSMHVVNSTMGYEVKV